MFVKTNHCKINELLHLKTLFSLFTAFKNVWKTFYIISPTNYHLFVLQKSSREQNKSAIQPNRNASLFFPYPPYKNMKIKEKDIGPDRLANVQMQRTKKATPSSIQLRKPPPREQVRKQRASERTHPSNDNNNNNGSQQSSSASSRRRRRQQEKNGSMHV